MNVNTVSEITENFVQITHVPLHRPQVDCPRQNMAENQSKNEIFDIWKLDDLRAFNKSIGMFVDL